MPTVAQVWRQVMPPGTNLIAGEDGIYNETTWVVTLRPTPPGFDRLRGNELALIDPGIARRLGVPVLSLVMSLLEQGAGSIAILGGVNPDVIGMAEKVNLPVLVIPSENDLLALESRISGMIREERDRLYSQEKELTSTLMDLALAGRGINSILGKLGEISNRSVILLDTQFEPYFVPHDINLKVLKQALSKSFPAPPLSIKGFKVNDNTSGFLSPVSGKQRTEGFLLVTAPSTELQESDRMLARVGSLALAIEMSRIQAVEDTEEKFRTEMLESLLNGDLFSSAAADRADRLGLDLSKRYTVMIVQSYGLSGDGINPKRAQSALGKKALCFNRGSSLMILFEVVKHSIDDMRRLKKETAHRLSSYLGSDISLGMGRSYIASDGLGFSLKEAEQALMIGKELFGEGNASFFGDLGVYRLLLSAKTEDLKDFYKESVGQLEDYDRQHGGELVRTLEEILKHPTIVEAAAALHVHRNTLLYRIQRIQEITNMNLGDGETRLTFHLALKVRDVIHRS